MKGMDHYLQRARINQVAPFFREGHRILDIGSADGGMFRWLTNKKITFSGIGLEPEIPGDIERQEYKILRETFPSMKISGQTFDLITALAVLEHIPKERLDEFAKTCNKHLKPKGILVMTVPSRWVDFIIKPLIWLRLMEGNRVDQHYGYDASLTIPLFSKNGFVLEKHSTFQIGLNNLFVFSKYDSNSST
jgi:2-polyprenyl-3-methyl-5-hydroxy-6-metoxy-1,4-benzoquinol methylase